MSLHVVKIHLWQNLILFLSHPSPPTEDLRHLYSACMQLRNDEIQGCVYVYGATVHDLNNCDRATNTCMMQPPISRPT